MGKSWLISRVIVGLYLIWVLLFWGNSALAGQLANRLAQFPDWKSKPPVTAVEGDLVYPDWMEGTWKATSTLVELVAPLAPEVVTPGFESNRRYLNKPVNFLVRFQANQSPVPSLKPAQTPISGLFIPSQPTTKIRTKSTSTGVVADRQFNGLSIAKAYLGDRAVRAVKVDPNSPNRQITILRTGRQLVSVVTGRATETPTPDRFIATEVSNQIFRGISQPYFNQVETTTAYQLQRSPQLAIRLLAEVGNREEGTGNSGQEFRQTVPEKYFGKRSIEADQVTAVYLSPQDADYFQVLDKPVALYRYRLELEPIKSTTASFWAD